MKKSLLALVAGLACISAAQAQSTVEVSGLVDVYAGSMKLAGKERTSVVGSGGMTTSWMGFSGKEDLGNGLKAEFAISAFLRADEGKLGRFETDPAFARDANVALSGGFGKLTLGRSMAPNFLPTILANPFGDSFTVSPLVMHANMGSDVPFWGRQTTQSDTGWSNQVTYSTPSIGGLKANLHYQFGEQADKSNKNNVGVNAMYFGGPLTLLGFYEQAKIKNPNLALMNNTTSNWMLGGSYDFNVIKAFATYGKAKEKTTNLHARTISLGLDMPVLNKAGSVKAAIARTEVEKSGQLGASGKPTRTTTSIGYDHFLSKRTDVYGVVMYDNVNKKITGVAPGIQTKASGTSFVVGMRHRF